MRPRVRSVLAGMAAVVVVATAAAGIWLAHEAREPDWPAPLATPVDLSCAAWTSVDVPKDIPDNDATGITSTVTVTDTQYIGWISAKVTISHTYVSDLEVKLVSPDGVTVTLLYYVDDSGNNFVDTLLHDDAGQDIDDAEAWDAPFTGAWRPSDPMSAFYNETANGTWTLYVRDTAPLDSGSLQAWELNICTSVSTMTPTSTPSVTPTPSQTPTATDTTVASSTPTMSADQCLGSLVIRLANTGSTDPCGTPGAPDGTAMPWVGRSVFWEQEGLVADFGRMIYLCPQPVVVAGSTPAAYYPTPMWHLGAVHYTMVQGSVSGGGSYTSLCPATPHAWPTQAPSSDCWAMPTDEAFGNCGVPWVVRRYRSDRFSGLYKMNSSGADAFGGKSIGCDTIVDACGISAYCKQWVEMTMMGGAASGCYFVGDETPVPTEWPTMTPYVTPVSPTPSPTATTAATDTATPTQGPYISEVLARPIPTGTPCVDWNLRSGCGVDDSFVEIGLPQAAALPDWSLAVHDGDDALTCSYTYRSDNYSWPMKVVWLDQPFVRTDYDKFCESFPITGTVYLYDDSDELMDTRAYTGTTHGSSWCAVDWEDPDGTWAVCTPSPGKD